MWVLCLVPFESYFFTSFGDYNLRNTKKLPMKWNKKCNYLFIDLIAIFAKGFPFKTRHSFNSTVCFIGGFHVTSSRPCWWTRTIDFSLAPFVRPPTFVHFTIVIFVSRDWLQPTYSQCHSYRVSLRLSGFAVAIKKSPPPPPPFKIRIGWKHMTCLQLFQFPI